jgi:hypothetical protein
MSNEQRTINEVPENSSGQTLNTSFAQSTGTVTTITSQQNRSAQPDIVQPDTHAHREILPSPTNKDLDAIINDCRRGETTKLSATKKLLESMERLTQLTAQTQEETFISYLAEINSIDGENIAR